LTPARVPLENSDFHTVTGDQLHQRPSALHIDARLDSATIAQAHTVQAAGKNFLDDTRVGRFSLRSPLLAQTLRRW
jgi:hypothetical protein